MASEHACSLSAMVRVFAPDPHEELTKGKPHFAPMKGRIGLRPPAMNHVRVNAVEERLLTWTISISGRAFYDACDGISVLSASGAVLSRGRDGRLQIITSGTLLVINTPLAPTNTKAKPKPYHPLSVRSDAFYGADKYPNGAETQN